MSVAPINKNDVIKYLAEILNINTENTLILDDMMEELNTLHDLMLFRAFIKEEFTEDKYKYLVGYQKFLALTKDFRKEYAPRLNANQKLKVNNFSEKLFKKTTDVFDWIAWEIQTGCDLHDKKINKKLYDEFGTEPKELEVLEEIGKRAELLRLCTSNKEILREKINKTVHKFALVSEFPELAHKTKEQLVIERLQKGKKMKAYLSINQKAFIDIANAKNKKVDYVDGALFDWINTFTHSQKALKKLIDNKLFIWVSYAAIREDNPMANITSNDVVGRRLNKLVDLGILEKHLSKEDGNKVFFHITQFAYDYLLESRELPTQKSEPLPTQKSDNSKLDNSELDSNKKNTKKKTSTNPQELIKFYKENISNLRAKIKEVSSVNAIALLRDDMDLILTGLKNYANDLPNDRSFVIALPNFVRNKIYLDYQVPIVKQQKPQTQTQTKREKTNNFIDEYFANKEQHPFYCEVLSE